MKLYLNSRKITKVNNFKSGRNAIFCLAIWKLLIFGLYMNLTLSYYTDNFTDTVCFVWFFDSSRYF